MIQKLKGRTGYAFSQSQGQTDVIRAYEMRDQNKQPVEPATTEPIKESATINK